MSIEPVGHARRCEHSDLSDPPRLLRVRREVGALDIHWSDGILDETTRNLIGKFDFTQDDAEVLVDRLSAYIPTALVEVKKRDQARVAKVEMDAKDRHVLAAALSANADLLLTQNVRHFPTEWMAKRGIELDQRWHTPHPTGFQLPGHPARGTQTRPQLATAERGSGLRDPGRPDRRRSRGHCPCRRDGRASERVGLSWLKPLGPCLHDGVDGGPGGLVGVGPEVGVRVERRLGACVSESSLDDLHVSAARDQHAGEVRTCPTNDDQTGSSYFRWG